MARVRRTDLYEGNGEVIGQESRNDSEAEESMPLPGRQPLGREEALQEKDAFRRQAEETHQKKTRYFAQNEGVEGLNAPSTLFDDFDRYEAPLPRSRKKRKRQRHRGAWIAVICFCLLFLTATGLLVLPQLTGLRFRFLPNLAFANGSVIRLEERAEENFEGNSSAIYHDAIYPGVYIDDLHVGGMSREKAIQALTEQSDLSGMAFDILVTVGNQTWHVNNERVPMSRNIEAVVAQAWALGRSNSATVKAPDRAGAATPFQERVNQASDMRSYPVSLHTEKVYDHTALRTLVEGIVNYVNRDPVNSNVESFDFNTKTFTFTDDVPGARLDAEDLYSQLEALLDAGDYYASIRVTPEKILAPVTKTELMNSFGLLSTYTTKTTSNKNRNTNIDLSARAINGKTVLAGELFSFNGTTGERTAAKGYKEAAAISGGSSRDEIGGGVCQTSSTLFNAVARANLEIVARSPHAWPSSYVEKGMDATVNWPELDFKFKNNTDWPIFIVAGYENRKITVSIYGMSLGADVSIDLESEVVKELPQPSGVNYVVNMDLKPGESKRTVTGRKGYVVDTWKVWYQNGKEVRREKLFTSTYKAYQETVEYRPR